MVAPQGALKTQGAEHDRGLGGGAGRTNSLAVLSTYVSNRIVTARCESLDFARPALRAGCHIKGARRSMMLVSGTLHVFLGSSVAR